MLLFVTLGLLTYLVGSVFFFLIFGSLTETIGKPELTLRFLVAAYTDPESLRLFGNTFIFAAGATTLSTVLGGITAWITERFDTPLQGLTRIGTLIPLIVPGIFYAIAWSLLLAPGGGMINVWLRDTFHLSASKGPIFINSLGGMIWVEGVKDAPFAYLIIMPLIRSMDPSFEEAAKLSGAGIWAVLRRITIPLSLPGILSVVLLRMVRGLEAFEVPAIIGLPKGIDVLATKIYTAISETHSYSMANAYGLGLMAITVVGLYQYQRMMQKSYRYVTITGRATAARKIALGRWRWLPTTFLAAYIIVVSVLPIGALVWFAIIPRFVQPSMKALSLITLENFSKALQIPYAVTAIWNTLIVTAGVATICVFIASIVSWLTVRTNLRGRNIVDTLSVLPVTMPGITVGIALVWIYLTLPIPIYGTLWILVVGYITVFLPTAVRFTTPGMTQIHKDLEECAQVCGASWWTTFRRILIPLALPSIAGAWLCVFLLTSRILSLAVVVCSASNIVLPVLVFNTWSRTSGHDIVALSLITIVILLPIGIMYYWLIQRYRLGGGDRG